MGLGITHTGRLSRVFRHFHLPSHDLTTSLDQVRLALKELLLKSNALRFVFLLDILKISVNISDLRESSQNLLWQVSKVVVTILVIFIVLVLLLFFTLLFLLVVLNRSSLSARLPSRLAGTTLQCITINYG